jgi:hypothetical protein
LRTFSKLLNNLHLNVLANISDVIGKFEKVEDDFHEDIMRNLMIDIKAYYRKTESHKKRFEDFKRRKFREIEIHEVITRVCTNLTKSSKNAFSLLDSYFYEDLLEFLVYISKTKKKFVEEIHMKRKKGKEEIAKITQSIIENSITVINNIFNSEGDTIIRAFMDIVKI